MSSSNAVRAAFERVFNDEDSFGTPVQPSMAFRSLGYVFPYALRLDQQHALASVCQVLAEPTVGILALESPRGIWEVVPSPDLYAIADVTGVQNAIVSMSGQWGILVSFEWHAILACANREVLDLFRRHMPEFEDAAVIAMLQRWKSEAGSVRDRTRVRWIPRQVFHVYGDDRGATLLRLSGWDPANP